MIKVCRKVYGPAYGGGYMEVKERELKFFADDDTRGVQSYVDAHKGDCFEFQRI